MHMQEKGYSHRDLKFENILIGKNYCLKLADMGFASQACVNTSYKGTQGYMAPEIVAGEDYQGVMADIFSAGVILFTMYKGAPPFQKSSPVDPFFKLLKDGKHDIFWRAHSKHLGEDYFSDEFKGLVVSMLMDNPTL